MLCLMTVSLLVAAGSADIQNDTTLPAPDPFRTDGMTLAPPDPFGTRLLAEKDWLEDQPGVTDDGQTLFEGDIVLTAEQRTGRKGATNLWHYGYVPYVITASSRPDRAVINQAVLHWRRSACVYLYERPESYNSSPHLRFIRSSGCWSYVGRRPTNAGQPVSIGPGCATLGIVAHEIGHALGFWHEQSRRDRNSYITILTSNIISNAKYNFAIRADEQSRGVPYDLTSLMHYGGFAFSRNGWPTIITKDVLLAGKMGQRVQLSHRDKHLANELYRCARFCTSIPRCSNGGYVDRTCRCVCPPGTSGTFCETITGPYYGRTCGNQFITRPGLITSLSFPALYPANQHCVWRVTAPRGRRVRIQFHTFRILYRYSNRCWWDWLAVHLNSDSMPDRITCGTELQGRTLTTTGNRLVLEMHSYRRQIPSLQTGFSATVTFF